MKTKNPNLKPPAKQLSSDALRKSGLNLLLGEWEVSSPQFPESVGRAVFEWLEDSAYLSFRTIANDPIPSSLWIIGADEASEFCAALYSDSRGTSRIYQMSLRNHLWKIWRKAPGFSQRFTARLSKDSKTIQGAWEIKQGGLKWKNDFDLVYKRLK
jgi:hypothetical protein